MSLIFITTFVEMGYQVSYSSELFCFVVGEYSTKPLLSRTLAKVITEKESVA